MFYGQNFFFLFLMMFSNLVFHWCFTTGCLFLFTNSFLHVNYMVFQSRWNRFFGTKNLQMISINKGYSWLDLIHFVGEYGNFLSWLSLLSLLTYLLTYFIWLLFGEKYKSIKYWFLFFCCWFPCNIVVWYYYYYYDILIWLRCCCC